jgi:hypothetical protein
MAGKRYERLEESIKKGRQSDSGQRFKDCPLGNKASRLTKDLVLPVAHRDLLVKDFAYFCYVFNMLS